MLLLGRSKDGRKGIHQLMWLDSDQVRAGLQAFGINRKLTATVTQNQEYLLPALTGSGKPWDVVRGTER